MFNVITFGSATSDTFLLLKEDFLTAGSKILVDDIKVESGGGGTNVACTFAGLGLSVAYCGKIGDDPAGKVILNELKKFGVSRKLTREDQKRKTAVSFVASPKIGDRTILAYEGACHFFELEEIPWQKIRKTAWFYIAPLYKKSALVLEPLLAFARANKIKTAVNLSVEQLAQGQKKLSLVLSKIDVLILNSEEAEILTGISRNNENEILRELVKLCLGIIVITKGKAGSIAWDGKNIYSAGIVPVRAIEATGAGDAYGSGFVAGLILKNNIEYAIKLGMANSASCISQIGAKNGLLTQKNLINLPAINIIKTQA